VHILKEGAFEGNVASSFNFMASSLELKLYEGRDFDFDNSGVKPYYDPKTTKSSFMKSGVQRQGGVIVEEDYTTKEVQK